MGIFFSRAYFCIMLHSIPFSAPIDIYNLSHDDLLLSPLHFSVRWALFGSAGSGSGMNGANRGYDCFGQQRGATRVGSRSGDAFPWMLERVE